MRRRGMGRKLRLVPIDSTKNIVPLDITTATLSVTVQQIAVGAPPSGIDETTSDKKCEQGSMIRGMYIEFRLYNRTGGLPGQEKCVIILRKNEDGTLPAPTLAQCNALGLQTWKDRVFQCHFAKPPGPDGIPMLAGSFRIPKRFHKMGQGDVWELIIANNGSGSVDGCGVAIYKWYR